MEPQSNIVVMPYIDPSRTEIEIQSYSQEMRESLISFGGTILSISYQEQFKYALVWGTSCKYSPQRVGLAHVLHHDDVIQIVKK